MTNAVIYIRDRNAPEEQTRLQMQRTACVEYCDKEGFVVDKVFVEETGRSAGTLDRPQLQELLAYCREKSNRVQFLVVYDFARLTRNASDHLAVKSLLQKYDVSLRSVKEEFPDTTGSFLETVMAATSQLDNKMRAELMAETDEKIERFVQDVSVACRQFGNDLLEPWK